MEGRGRAENGSICFIVIGGWNNLGGSLADDYLVLDTTGQKPKQRCG